MKLNVPLGARSYDILIEDGLIERLPELMSGVLPAGEKLIIVSDENVWELYGKFVGNAFDAFDIDAHFIQIPPGEINKTQRWLSVLYERFAAVGLSRKGIVASLGGGVIGDLAGFAAATWMRGVGLIHVPTTLLAQVDSSVGGKTAIDIDAGKNLVGAFHQPRMVLIDPTLLKTLPDREFRSGMAEVVKYGAIASFDLFNGLKSLGKDSDLSNVICECCRIKSEIVVRDELDAGRRAILNFGHTFGHAIEAKYGFERFTHGEAVAAGMYIAAGLGERLGVTPSGVHVEIERALKSFGLDVSVETEGLTEIIRRDKKSDSKGVNLILLNRIGEAAIHEVSFSDLEGLVSAIAPTGSITGVVEDEPIGAPDIADEAVDMAGLTSQDEPAKNVSVKIIRKFPAGIVRIPPSKSIMHRSLICEALGGGLSHIGELIGDIGGSEDVAATMGGLESIIAGDAGPIDCGESGSTIRFLIPLAGLSDREWVFTGRGKLLERPMDIYEAIFERNGGYLRKEADGIHIHGPIGSGTYHIPGNVSSQFVSGLLMALPLASGNSEVIISPPLESGDYVMMTAAVMEWFGVKPEVIKNKDGKIFHCRIPGGSRYMPSTFSVEGDYTQAANFLAAGAMGRPVSVEGLSPLSLQGDRRILKILTQMGAKVKAEGNKLKAEPGPMGLHSVEIDASDIPDLVPPIAALACYARGTTRIFGAARLRLKESDRLRALTSALGALGAGVEEQPDGLLITGKPLLDGGSADAHGDHRIAMAVAVASIGCRGPVSLTGWENVAKSYPEFWDDFERESREGL